MSDTSYEGCRSEHGADHRERREGDGGGCCRGDETGTPGGSAVPAIDRGGPPGENGHDDLGLSCDQPPGRCDATGSGGNPPPPPIDRGGGPERIRKSSSHPES